MPADPSRIPDDPDFFIRGGSGGGYSPPTQPGPGPGGGAGVFGFGGMYGMPSMPFIPPTGRSRRMFATIPAGAMRTAYTESSLPPSPAGHGGGGLGALLMQLLGGGR